MSIEIEETKKRLEILDKIAAFIENNSIPVDSSRYGGSMSFAKNFAIRKTSDIDLDVFISFKRLPKLNLLLEYLGIARTFGSNEDWSNMDLISTDGKIDEVDINLWIFDSDKFGNIADLKRNYMSYFTIHKPSELKDYNVLGGGTCTLDREVKESKDGYISKRWVLNEGYLISENYILNNLFFVTPIIGKEFSDDMVNRMWDALLQKYPDVTVQEIKRFLINNVKERFSPDFTKQLDALLYSKLGSHK